jgi:hypothetical protein
MIVIGIDDITDFEKGFEKDAETMQGFGSALI